MTRRVHLSTIRSHSQKHGQDQVASIKQTLVRCIDGIQIFLDVDAEQLDTQDLPALVRRSRNIVLFATEEVCAREFVRIELHTAISQGVDVIVLRETDPRHGSISPEQLEANVPDHMRPVLLANELIDYHRVVHFRNVSMVKLVQRLLVNADRRKYRVPPELMMPDDIADKAFAPPEAGRVHVFFANTTDKLFIATVPKFIAGLKIVSAPYLAPEKIGMAQQGLLPPLSSSGQAAGDSAKDANEKKYEWQALVKSAGACVALLTPETMADTTLQQQLQMAMGMDKDVVLIHDLRRPNEFSNIIEACPKGLKDKGIFDQLAVPLYGGEFEHTSMKLLWQRLSEELGGSGSYGWGRRKGSRRKKSGAAITPSA